MIQCFILGQESNVLDNTSSNICKIKFMELQKPTYLISASPTDYCGREVLCNITYNRAHLQKCKSMQHHKLCCITLILSVRVQQIFGCVQILPCQTWMHNLGHQQWATRSHRSPETKLRVSLLQMLQYSQMIQELKGTLAAKRTEMKIANQNIHTNRELLLGSENYVVHGLSMVCSNNALNKVSSLQFW